MWTSSRCADRTRNRLARAAILALVGVMTAALGCASPTETDHLRARIREAHQELTSTGARETSFAERVPTTRPYVLVVIPAGAVDATAVRASDLPEEAKEAILRQVEHRDLQGALLGFLQVDHSVWHTLPEAVNASALLYAWKQSGEGVSVRMVRTSGGTTIVAVR